MQPAPEELSHGVFWKRWGLKREGLASRHSLPREGDEVQFSKDAWE